jgi:hypothetical protein
MISQKEKGLYPRHIIVVKNETVKIINNSITDRIMY